MNESKKAPKDWILVKSAAARQVYPTVTKVGQDTGVEGEIPENV